MKKVLSVAVVCFVMLGVLAGSVSAVYAADGKFEDVIAGKGKGLKVGITVSDLISIYISSAAEYTKRLLELSGAEVVLVNCENNASVQSTQIDDFISMGCNVIAIHAADAEALAPAAAKAKAAGIVVLGFNKEIKGGSLDFAVVSSNNVQTGAKAAQWLASKAKELGVKNPKIAVMQGTMSQSDAYLRQEGIDKVASDEGLVLINNPCDWSSDKAEKMLNDNLTANPDLFGVITHCDSMDAGVASALRQANKAVPSDKEGHVWWSGIDADPDGINALNSGLMDTCVEQSPLELATVITKGILDYAAKGISLKGEILPMDTAEVTKANTADPNRWALYDMKSTELWANTANAWNKYVK
jgi:ribose transport system substrate-binding protein